MKPLHSIVLGLVICILGESVALTLMHHQLVEVESRIDQLEEDVSDMPICDTAEEEDIQQQAAPL